MEQRHADPRPRTFQNMNHPPDPPDPLTPPDLLVTTPLTPP